MATDAHLLGRFDWTIAVADQDTAMDLRLRVEALARERMPASLDRILDLLAPPGLCLQIDRLDLDLGRFDPHDLETDVPDAFERALTEALLAALHDARHGAADARLVAEPEASLARFEAYLASGVSPSAGERGDLFESRALARRLIDEQPAALAAMLRRIARNRRAIERLVLQTEGEALYRLLAILAPADAALILTLMDEQRRTHRREPLRSAVPIAEPALDQLLWMATIEFLLRDAGSQFNRRRYLGFLLRREAERGGIAYADLRRLMGQALRRARVRAGEGSSLAMILADLLAEEEHDPQTSTSAPDETAASLMAARSGAFDGANERAIRAARSGDIAALVEALRTRTADAAIIETIAAMLDPTDYVGLIEHLRPQTTAWTEELDGLIALHARSPVMTLSAEGFALLLRSIALRVLLRPDAGGFTRDAWLRAVIVALAAERRMTEGRLRKTIARAIVATGMGSAALRALLASDILAAGEDLALLPERPWAKPGHAASDIRRRWLRRALDDPLWLVRQGAAMGKRDRTRVIGWLAPAAAKAEVLEVLNALREHSALRALVRMDRAGFETHLWALAIGYLADLGGRPFERRMLERLLLSELARHAGVAADDFAGRLQLGQRAGEGGGGTAHDTVAAFAREYLSDVPDRDDGWAALEAFLIEGAPISAGRVLPVLAAQQSGELAARLRRIAREAPGRLRDVVGRLLDCLLPEELVDILAPGLGGQALRWMDEGGGDNPDDWYAPLIALLRGETPALDMPSDGFVRRIDRLAAIAHWLDHGTVPGWSELGATVAMLMATIDEMNRADLNWLFVTGDRERTAHRIARVLDLLDERGRARLIARLAPWMARDKAMLATALAGLEPSARTAVLARIAAASIEGGGFDLRALLENVTGWPALVPSSNAIEGAEDPIDPARLFAWLDGGHLSAADEAAMILYFIRVVDEGDPALAAYVDRRKSSRAARAAWARRLPYAAAGRMLRLVRPVGAAGFLDGAMLLQTASRRIGGFGSPRIAQAELWAMLLDLAAEPIALPEMLRRLSHRMSGDDAGQAARLREEARRIARDAGGSPVATALKREPAAATADCTRPRPADPAPEKRREPEPEPKHTLHIANAGLVLLSPYLPTLFDRLGLLGSDADGKPAIMGLEARSRVVHLLQYMVDERLDRPEPALPLNKLLCGLSPSTPIEAEIAPVPADLELCDGLLGAVIGNWTILGNTSLAGLRETFLQREGLLARKDDRWELRVERKGLDVLVDHIPWTFATVLHRWMAEPIHVTW